MTKQVGPYLALFEIRQENSVDPACQQPGEVGLAQAQWRLAEVVAVTDQDVESVELHLIVMLAAVQAVEVGNAIDAKQNCFAIVHEGAVPVAQRGFDDERIAVTPVGTVSGEQADACLPV